MNPRVRKLEEFYDALSRICRAAAQLLHADAGAIYLREGDEFVMRASFGSGQDLIGKARYKPGEGITGWIGQGNVFKADSREEVESHPGHSGKYNRQLWGDPSFYCWSLVGIPLRLGGHVLGVLKVENKREGGRRARFSGEDVRDLEIFVGAITDGIGVNDDLLHLLGSLYVFVQIPFRKEFTNVYSLGIKQTVETLGMRCEKVDEVKLPHDILRQIYECIRKSDIVISEMTDRNPNVFYETGYAHALDKPTILLAQSADDIPFDLRHFKHIIYDARDIPALQEELSKVLVATRREMMTAVGVEHRRSSGLKRRR
jgi:GAF domain